jgi:hypothetical protein
VPEIQFEVSGNSKAEPSDINMFQGARADGEADANVEALVPPVCAIEMPLPDQREQEPLLSRGRIPNTFPDPAGAAGCPQDDVTGGKIIPYGETSPSGPYWEPSDIVSDHWDMAVADNSS